MKSLTLRRGACTLGVLAVGAPLLLSVNPTPASADAAPIRIVASSQPIVDSRNTTWIPDAPYATGGSLSTSGQAVTRTASPQLYQAQRTGVSAYAIPAPDACTYSVVLYLAELGGKGPGQRVYDVDAEGSPVAPNVDVSAQAGKNAAWHVLFTVPVTDGTLNLTFAAIHGTPAVSAVAVDFMHPALIQNTTFDDEFNDIAGTPPLSSNWTQDWFAGFNN